MTLKTLRGFLKMQSDVLSVLNKEGSVVVMIILDLSAGFDTIDCEFSLSRVRDIYGIQDQAKWGLAKKIISHCSCDLEGWITVMLRVQINKAVCLCSTAYL